MSYISLFSRTLKAQNFIISFQASLITVLSMLVVLLDSWLRQVGLVISVSVRIWAVLYCAFRSQVPHGYMMKDKNP